jgi:Uma2 family endonuclease
MSIAAVQPAALEPPPFPVRRFTVEEYHRLGALGVLTEDDRVELIEGLVVPKMNRSPLHDVSLNMLDNVLREVLPPRWNVRVQMAITTFDSEPEPDIAVVVGPASRYVDHHPLPTDVALAVEVAETSLARDRRKARMYARAGVLQYWIVNLRDDRVEVHSLPQADVAEPFYASVVALGVDETCSLLLPGELSIAIPIRDFLPSHGQRGTSAP